LSETSLVIGEQEMKDNMKILVGIDGSDHSKGALIEAINVAKKFSGFIKVITVYKQGMDGEAKKVLEEAEQYLKKEKIDYNLSSILGSNPSRALITIANHENFDLIVVGSRGLGHAASFLLGSVSRKVVSKSHCDVLVVKK
jgi:nucleotide-binding universal stress UspA family protein